MIVIECVSLTESLEIQFIFQNVVESVAVLASVTAIDLIDSSGTSSDSICKRPALISFCLLPNWISLTIDTTHARWRRLHQKRAVLCNALVRSILHEL